MFLIIFNINIYIFIYHVEKFLFIANIYLLTYILRCLLEYSYIVLVQLAVHAKGTSVASNFVDAFFQ